MIRSKSILRNDFYKDPFIRDKVRQIDLQSADLYDYVELQFQIEDEGWTGLTFNKKFDGKMSVESVEIFAKQKIGGCSNLRIGFRNPKSQEVIWIDDCLDLSLVQLY